MVERTPTPSESRPFADTVPVVNAHLVWDIVRIGFQQTHHVTGSQQSYADQIATAVHKVTAVQTVVAHDTHSRKLLSATDMELLVTDTFQQQRNPFVMITPGADHT